MKMIVKSIEYINNETYVLGSTDVGFIKGKWYYKETPIMGEMYFCELNLDELEQNDILILGDEYISPSVCFTGKDVQFKGICEEIDDIYILRFAVDWIEMISVNNDDFSIKRGDIVLFSLSYERIGIYPY